MSFEADPLDECAKLTNGTPERPGLGMSPDACFQTTRIHGLVLAVRARVDFAVLLKRLRLSLSNDGP